MVDIGINDVIEPGNFPVRYQQHRDQPASAASTGSDGAGGTVRAVSVACKIDGSIAILR